jgi:perosamine synthetase
MNRDRIAEILARGRPGPRDVPWWGEPNLGSWYTEEEVEAAVRAIRESMDWTVGFGPNPKEIEEFENAFAEYCGVEYAIATNSCGTGLGMAIRCLDLEPGDEVISPAINYKAAHLSIIDQGGKVVFCDIDPKTLNLDPNDLERRITNRTRAILPVHMNGLSAPMDEIIEIAERNPHPKYGPLKVIGDAARSCGATYKGAKVGQKGWLTVFSFHTKKLMTTLGEGGAITTDDPLVAKRLRDMRQFGGEDGWGSNYKMTKVQAAVGLVQLKRLDSMNRKRIEVAKKRTGILKTYEQLTLPYEPEGYKHIYYVYCILVPPEWAGEKRDTIISILGDKYNIVCSVSNPPTYKRWEYIRRMCGDPGLPISEMIGSRLLCLPLYPLMTDQQNEFICAALVDTMNKID